MLYYKNLNSKKFFIKSVKDVLPDKNLLTRPVIQDITLDSLSFIATSPIPNKPSAVKSKEQAKFIIENKYKLGKKRQETLMQDT